MLNEKTITVRRSVRLKKRIGARTAKFVQVKKDSEINFDLLGILNTSTE